MSERLTDAELATLKTLCEGRQRFGIVSATVRVDTIARLLWEVAEHRNNEYLHESEGYHGADVCGVEIHDLKRRLECHHKAMPPGSDTWCEECL